MAISEDTGNQPVAVHSATKTATTASFSPQANTLLVVCVAVDGPTSGATTVAVSDSLSGSWSLLKRQNTISASALGGSSEVWCQYFASAPGSMTVTAAWSTGSNGGNLVVRSLLGAASTQTGATGGTGGAVVAPSATLTPTQIGSWVYGACLDYTTNASMTALGTTSLIDQFQDATNGDTWAAFKGAASTSSLSSTTYGFSNANTAYNTAAAEILAASAAAVPPSPLIVGQAVRRASLW